MATILAQATGNWETPATWLGGTVPTSGDTADPNSFVVTINTSVAVDALTQTSAGGYFSVTSPNIDIVANLIQSYNVSLLRFSHTTGTCSISGNIVGSTFATSTNNNSVTMTGTGTLNVSGSVIGGVYRVTNGISQTNGTLNVWGNVTGGVGGSSSSYYNSGILVNGATATFNVYGTVTGGSGATTYSTGIRVAAGVGTIVGNIYADIGYGVYYTGNLLSITGNCYGSTKAAVHGVYYNGVDTINITGNCYGLSFAAAYAVSNGSTGIINITGDVYAGSAATTYGVHNAVAGVVNITGNCYGGTLTTAQGVYNAGAGVINITGIATSGAGTSAYGANNVGAGTLNVTTAACGTNLALPGVWGTAISGLTTIENFIQNEDGGTPIGGFVKMKSSGLNRATMALSTGGTKILQSGGIINTGMYGGFSR